MGLQRATGCEQNCLGVQAGSPANGELFVWGLWIKDLLYGKLVWWWGKECWGMCLPSNFDWGPVPNVTPKSWWARLKFLKSWECKLAGRQCWPPRQQLSWRVLLIVITPWVRHLRKPHLMLIEYKGGKMLALYLGYKNSLADQMAQNLSHPFQN